MALLCEKKNSFSELFTKHQNKKNILTQIICLWHSIPFNNPHKNVIWQLLEENFVVVVQYSF